MTVAIETSPLYNAHGIRGTGAYTRSLIEALQKNVSGNSYTLFTRGQKLPKAVDIIHYPYFDPFFLTLPILKSKPTVVTIHDLIPIAYSDHFPRGFRGFIKWEIQKRSLLNTSQVITDSIASKEMIRKYTSYPSDRISVIYLAPRDIFFTDVTESARSIVKKKYSLPDKFILYVGDINWNKNIDGLLRAFAKINRDNSKIYLLLVGKTFVNDTLGEIKNINLLIQKFNMDQKIIKTGYIPDEDLHVVYSLAMGCVQPSHAEGFGLPVIEAMASGCPCVVSKNTSLNEIAGPSIIVDPDSVESIAAGVQELIKKDISQLRFKNTEWAKKYSWRTVAMQTNDVYKKIMKFKN